MFHYRLFWLAAFCFAAASGLVSGKEIPEQPAVAISLDKWGMRIREPRPFSKAGQSFSMKLKVMETSPPWRVVDGTESSFELALADSEGSSPSGTTCYYSEAYSSQRSSRAGTVFLKAHSWLPSEKARWVEARGKLPFIVYSGAAVSESVTLKPAVKDFSVPLVLKNAGLDGVDVKVEVKGYCDENIRGGKACVLQLDIHSSVPLGFLDMELYSRDGKALLAENYGSSSGHSAKRYNWRRYFRMEGKEEEIKVAVKYATGLRKIMVPVHIRCGLFGVVEQPDIRNKEK